MKGGECPEMKGWRSTNWMEILDPKEARQRTISFYRQHKTATHITVRGKGKVAQLKLSKKGTK